MGSYESIHNDTNEPVKVWWALDGGDPPDGGYKTQVLDPNLTTAPDEFTLSLVHQVCVKYRIPGATTDEQEVCKEESSPPLVGQHYVYQVSDIIDQGAFPPYNHEGASLRSPYFTTVTATTSSLSALQQRGNPLNALPMDYVVGVVFTLGLLMLVKISVNKYRYLGSQERLPDVHEGSSTECPPGKKRDWL